MKNQSFDERLEKQRMTEALWQKDRIEWRNWMETMREKFSRMHATPQDRVNYERRNGLKP